MYRIEEGIADAMMHRHFDTSTNDGRAELLESIATDWEGFADEIAEAAENIEMGETANNFRDYAEEFRNDIPSEPDDEDTSEAEYESEFLELVTAKLDERPELELQA